MEEKADGYHNLGGLQSEILRAIRRIKRRYWSGSKISENWFDDYLQVLGVDNDQANYNEKHIAENIFQAYNSGTIDQELRLINFSKKLSMENKININKLDVDIICNFSNNPLFVISSMLFLSYVTQSPVQISGSPMSCVDMTLRNAEGMIESVIRAKRVIYISNKLGIENLPETVATSCVGRKVCEVIEGGVLGKIEQRIVEIDREMTDRAKNRTFLKIENPGQIRLTHALKRMRKSNQQGHHS